MFNLFESTVPTITSTEVTSVTTVSNAQNNGSETVKIVFDAIINWITNTGIKIIIALLIMFIAFKIINSISKKLAKRLAKRNADATLSRVLVGAIRISLKGLVLICLIGYVGIETASLSAVVASFGVGISLAVQGTLSNFAGGVIIIVMRPFKLGDFIVTNGESGTVEDIKLFYTHLVTPDNRAIMIPNGTLANNVIVNNSAKDTRRVDVVMGISYSSNVELAKNLIKKVFANNELILKNPAPFVEVSNYGESSIDLTVRAWSNRNDYWTVYYYLLNEIKKEFDENGIQIPFNTIDVNINTNNE